jgi:hypothetical protein
LSEVVVKCPLCGDHPRHNHLSLNIEKGVYHCYFCDAGGSLKKLLAKYPDLASAVLVGGLLPERESSPLRTAGFAPLEKTGQSRRRDEALAFLAKRGMNNKMIRDSKVQLTYGDPKCEHRVVFPDLTGGPAQFWAARAIGSEKPKWLFPSRGETAVSAHQAVWGIENFARNREKALWLCEGIFDAMAVSGVACFGKKPSDGQLRKIISALPADGYIVIAQDADAQEDAKELQRKLRGFIRTTIAAPTLYNDYGDYLQHGYMRLPGAEFPDKVEHSVKSFVI